MELGKQSSAVLSLLFISFLVVGLFSVHQRHSHHLLIFDNNEASSLDDDLNYVQSGATNKMLSSTLAVLNWLKSSISQIPKFQSTTNNNDQKLKEFTERPLSLNLSSCHPSYSKGHRLVNCCPATDDAAQPIIDFQFPDTSTPKRIRRPAHRMDADYIAKYEKAVGVMKNLHKDHPHNFFRQANIHCLYCTGGYMQSNSSLLFNVHRSWFFFPWHRAMIYFHERILGKLMGDDSFTLPYWQWDAPEGMMMPQMYFNGYLNDKSRDYTHFPPRIADHSYVKIESGLDSEAQIEYNLAFMYSQMVSGAKKTELFMGCKLSAGEEGYCNGPGTIENAPHNTLHTWVGSGFNPERENMGSFYSAARDPIFYAHHANIDRLWSVWKKLNGNKPEFTDNAWLDTHFYFYDENLQLVRVKVSDVLELDKLGYEYEEAELPWLNARPKPAVDPKLAKKLLANNMITDSSNNNGNNIIQLPSDKIFINELQAPWTLDKTIRVRVHRPRTHKIGDYEEEILVVYGIDTKEEHTKFDVFVNLVDESKANVGVREFAGTVVSLPHGWNVNINGDHKGMHTKSHLKLGISEILHDLQADEDDSILVTLVPRIASNAVMSTMIDGIRIEYM